MRSVFILAILLIGLGRTFSQNTELQNILREIPGLNLTINSTGNATKAENTTVEGEKGLRINPISWDNVLKGLSEMFNEINRLFNSLWESIRGYINDKKGDSEDLEKSSNGTLSFGGKESGDRVLWSVTIPEMKIDLPKFVGNLLGKKNTKGSGDERNEELMKINKSTSEEEILSGILLSCAFFALYLICWILAFVKDSSDWVGVLGRPHTVFLQQIPTSDLQKKEKISESVTMFNGVLIPYTNAYMIPPIHMKVGHLRTLTITMQTLFFPWTIVHFLTSRFKISHFHFEYFSGKLKSFYETFRKEGLALSYYYMNNWEYRVKVVGGNFGNGEEVTGGAGAKTEEIKEIGISEKKFFKSLYDENILVLTVMRFVSKKENYNKLPSSEDVKEWCDGFWFKINKLDEKLYREFLPRIACLIILRKVVNNEYLSQDYLRRLRMQIIGGSDQGYFVRDWVRASLIKGNPRLEFHSQWVPRRPAGSIRITLHEFGILTLIKDFKGRVGIHSEGQIELLKDVTSGELENLDCYLWLVDELQTVCIHPVILCECYKGYDSLEWLGPMGFIPFEKITSIPINDVVNGTITLVMGKRKPPVTSAASLKFGDGASALESAIYSSNGEVGTGDLLNSAIKLTVVNEKDDISSLNHLIKSLVPQSKLRSGSLERENSDFSTEASRSLDLGSTMSSTLPRSVLNEGTNDVFWGDRLNLRSKNQGFNEFETNLHSSCFWDFDMPIPYTATSVLINDVLTYIWINYDSKLLCIQRKDVSIERIADFRLGEKQKSQTGSENEQNPLSKLRSFDEGVVIESIKTSPGSDSCIEILNLDSILNEPSEKKKFDKEFEKGKKAVSTVTRGLMDSQNPGSIESIKENQLNSEKHNSNIEKWLPFDKSLVSVFGVLTSEEIQSLHPVYAVPGILGGSYCTRGYFIGSIISVHVVKDFVEDIVDEYAIGIESQLLITFEGGLNLRISTFSQGAANSIKENLEQIISCMEENLMMPMSLDKDPERILDREGGLESALLIWFPVAGNFPSMSRLLSERAFLRALQGLILYWEGYNGAQ
ncbi:putative integral membrane protein [Cryptosporidium felis]|nr:putative integral membrane protein [Cryptosporidium felis]